MSGSLQIYLPGDAGHYLFIKIIVDPNPPVTRERGERRIGSIDFQTIKEAVTAREAAEYYGLTVNRYGMALCPFHEDRHPSLKLDERYHCFGCGADGSVIDFVAELFQMSLCDAARKLASDFGITCFPAGRSSVQLLQRPQKRYIQHETKELENLYYYRRLRSWRKLYAPKAISEDYHPLFVEALKNEDYIEYLLDVLLYGTEEERIALLKDQAHAVSVLERRFSEEPAQKGA